MTKKELINYIEKKNRETDNMGNIFAPPITGQECLHILKDHFLGSDWYSVNPISQEQINTEILAEIILTYPGYNEKFHRRIARFFKRIKDAIKEF